jgi:hypothetical protein
MWNYKQQSQLCPFFTLPPNFTQPPISTQSPLHAHLPSEAQPPSYLQPPRNAQPPIATLCGTGIFVGIHLISLCNFITVHPFREDDSFVALSSSV